MGLMSFMNTVREKKASFDQQQMERAEGKADRLEKRAKVEERISKAQSRINKTKERTRKSKPQQREMFLGMDQPKKKRKIMIGGRSF